MNTWMRRLLDTAALLLMGLGTLWGFGLLGNPVEQTAGGAFSADATLLAPATPAFSIWSVIYLLLVAYVVWLWTPAGGASERARSLGWLPAASILLNGAGWASRRGLAVAERARHRPPRRRPGPGDEAARRAGGVRPR